LNDGKRDKVPVFDMTGDAWASNFIDDHIEWLHTQ